MDTFDSFDNDPNLDDLSDHQPFQFRDDTSEEGTLKWLNKNFELKEKAAEDRIKTYRRYMALYKGIHWRSQDAKESSRDTEVYADRNPRMAVNFIWEMVESSVSKLARLRSNIAVIPRHDEQSDVNNAKACKLLLTARAEELNLEVLLQESDRIKKILGMTFSYITWNKDIGPLHPAYEKAKKFNMKPEDVDKKLGLGSKQSIHLGDVDVKNLGPDRVFPQIGQTCWDDCDEVDVTHRKNLYQLRAEYKNKKDKIQENKKELYDYSTTELSVPKDKVLVKCFYHRPTKWLPEGAKILYTEDVILSWEDFPYNHGELPLVPDTDIDVYGELWGRSFISNIENMQRLYNNVQSSVARDHGIGSAPKWMMPKGSVNISSLNNDFGVIEFTGAIPPKLVAHAPTSNQAFEIQDRLESKIAKHSKVYDISRGEVPAGITANSALRFLDEQESQSGFTDEVKRKVKVLKVYKMMMNLMAQYYSPSDGRTVRTLGKKNEYLIETLKDADFSRVYDIKIENSSALPDTKTGKISAIIDLNAATQTDPIFRKEEIVQMLDLGLDDAFKDRATASVDQAGQILDMMLKGKEVPEPEKFDNLIIHYEIFKDYMETISFKMKTDPAIQSQIKNRVLIIEGLMWERSMKNPAFAQQLMLVDSFPMFFEVPMPPAPPAMPPAGAEGSVDSTKIQPSNLTGEGNKQE